jgi:hypothetical protein
MQLYQRLMGNAQQHTGLIAISWISGVRASMAGHSSSSGGSSSDEAVRFAVLHTCVALVALAVGGGSSGVQHMQEAMGLSSNSCLVTVLEGLLQALMMLQSQFGESSTGQAAHHNGDLLTAWRQQLQAGSSTAAGQAVAGLLQWL